MTERNDDPASAAADPLAPPGMLRALRGRNYQLFFGGQLISLIGNFLTATAMAWMVFRLATEAGHHQQAGRWLGVVGFATQFPLFLIAPFAGVWIDRIDRRRLLVLTQALATVQSLSLAALAFTHIEYWQVVALAAFQGLINAFDIPARQAFLVQIVADREDLPNAIALNSSMVHAARLIGPAAAGFLIYYFGEKVCFLIDGISYLAVIAALLAMRLAPMPPRPISRGILAELTEGARYVWGFTPIRAVLMLMATVSLTVTPAFLTLAPIFADALSGQGRGSQALGWIMASSGLGALIGAIRLARRRSVLGLGRVIAGAAISYSIALALFGVLGAIGGSGGLMLILAMVVIGISGYAMITTFASANTVIQTLSDDDKRGRVMSFFSMAFMGMTPFGALLAGYAADKWMGGGVVGSSRVLWICAAIAVGSAAMFAAQLPALRAIVRPVYVRKGIIREVARGIQTATSAVEGQRD